MTTRTSTETVTFSRPFYLNGLDEAQPAGAYQVETDEELIQGISFTAYRKVLTLIYLNSENGHSKLTRPFEIDPDDLTAALKQDEELPVTTQERAPTNY
ncbi:MAG: hypothetical protein OQJ97_17790 [Rhodospirillales bacterium]|nr:hypothetical protein [Rhodospirillales bacterium]